MIKPEVDALYCVEGLVKGNRPEASPLCVELGDKPPERYRKQFLDCGWRHVSVDLAGQREGLLNLDLTQPIDAVETFGERPYLVTNFGTSEHVSNQHALWSNVHAWLDLGGWLVHVCPAQTDWEAWAGHGYWYATLDWWVMWSRLNGYEVHTMGIAPWQEGHDDPRLRRRDVTVYVGRKRVDKPCVMPPAHLMARHPMPGKVGNYDDMVAA